MIMREPISRLLPFILLMCGTSCSLQKDKSTGENAVARFHTQFNAGQYHDIYAQTDEGFRKNTSEEQMAALLGAIQRKLGLEKDANQVDWRVNATTAGTQVFLTYRTTFTEGDATEQFVFFVSGNNARLFKYNIESPLLITK